MLGVPLLVPLGWWAFAMIAIAVAPPAVRCWWRRWPSSPGTSALDPLMVEQGFWSFAGGPLLRGAADELRRLVPLAGLLLTWRCCCASSRGWRDEVSADLRGVFLAQAFLIGVGLLVFGLPLATLVSVPAMLLLASTWWWWRTA
jgi:hypothetical protein